jgi:hypothetical protein
MNKIKFLFVCYSTDENLTGDHSLLIFHGAFMDMIRKGQNQHVIPMAFFHCYIYIYIYSHHVTVLSLVHALVSCHDFTEVNI